MERTTGKPVERTGCWTARPDAWSATTSGVRGGGSVWQGDYTVVRKTSSEHVTPSSHPCVSGGLSRIQNLITVPPPHSLIHERDSELTNKIIQLLTGEVEYIEEHRGLYMDVLVKNHRVLSSLDGSSNRNTPDRCPRPLYTQENHSIPQEYPGEYLNDIKVEVIEEDEEMYVRGDQLFKGEEIPTDLSTDGSSNRDTPERCPRPLYTQDSTEENHRTPQEYQGEDLTYIKIEDLEGEEEMYVIRAQQYEEEGITADASTRREATLQHRRPQMRRHHESLATQANATRQPGRSSQVILAHHPAFVRHSSHLLGKKRRPNFSYQEVDILVNNVVDMLMTASSSLTSAGKLAIWQQITHNVNTMAPITRSVEEVKKRWQDFKRRLKEKLREHHRQVRVNSGGPISHLLLTPLEQRAMVCIHQEQIQGLDGGDTVRPMSAQQLSTGEDVEDQQQSPRSPRLDPQSPSPPPPLPLTLPSLPLPSLPESPPAALGETSSRPHILQELQSDRAAALEYYDRLMEIQRQQLTLQERQAEALEGVGATLSRLATVQERLASAQERQNIIMEGMVSVFKRMSGLSMPTLYGLGGASAAGEPEPQEPPAPSPPAASVARLTRRQERPQEPTPASEGKRLKRGKK
ncbi:uncharacterized protein LOC135054782 [Pseudophryne corroboree]|uniref:uncharacterized protein LOC135054782 n=1 Tax=Pseudophryne corroboree TaxID=495146 RepID=UPI0030819EB2